MNNTRVETALVAVTVYPGQARISRQGSAELAAGRQRAVVGGLPLGLHADSVRVNGRGPATVLGVDVGYEHHPRSTDSTVVELEERRLALEAQLAELGDENTVATAREQQLSALSQRSGKAFATALAAGAVEVSRVAEVGAALAGQLEAVLAGRRELLARRRAVQQEHDEVNRRLGERLNQQLPDRRAIEVELEVADGGGTVEFEVSYLVDDAHWESHYDVRLRGDTLTLTWFGLITQHSGEDWPECDLRLSTARPASAVTVPELDPWYLHRFEPPTVYRGGPARREMAFDAMADMAGAPGVGGAAPQAMLAKAADLAELTVASAGVEHGVTAATYQPTRPVAVPADGSAHRTTVLVAELPARLDHVTVPLRGPEAYLRATVVNTSEHTLRPGSAAIFHDTEFVGTTVLEPWAPGEEAELALGIDDRIRVRRELTRRSAGKAVLGGTRRHEAAYTITIGNFGPRTAAITVLDQVPVSRDEAIVVRDVHCEPKPAELSDLGEITWKLELTPNQSAELTTAFRVDVGKGVTLAGWRD